MNMTIKPEKDGIDHIWLSPLGKTELGRVLYIGAYRPFTDPTFGSFSSIIAFWAWFDSGRVDSLRTLHQDNMIRSSLAGLKDIPGNRRHVSQVLRSSILQDAALTAKLRNSSLPFKAYEVHNIARSPGKSTVYALPDREWYVRTIEDLRKELKN